MLRASVALAAALSAAVVCGESLEAKIAAKHKILVSDQWGGGHRMIFDFNGRKGWIVEPKEPAAGRPWVWTMQWMGAFLDRTGAPAIVRAGGYHVHLEAFDTRADDEGLAVLAAYQDYLVDELGFAPKARLIGMSWGGFYSVRYAAAYPEKVASVYLDAPLLNVYTLPNVTGTDVAADAKVIGPWAASRPAGDVADDPRQAVNLAETVASAKIPILLLYGGQDQTVDPARNCELFVPRFKAAGGQVEVKRRGLFGHHPHGVDERDVALIADFFGLPAKAASAASDEIVEGTHGYTPDGYVEPREPAVREALERFRDRKLGLMMHWGPYCQLGIVRAESWPLSDADADWARKGWTGVTDNEAFKRMYLDLPKTFAPTNFDPSVWAEMAKRDGFRYVVFTTKHHDGFCLFDSKFSDYRITNPAFPFAQDPRADIAKGVFDAFRAKGLSTVCYFSKPDWHHDDFWENAGLGVKTSRWPTYAVTSHPEKWENFRKYVRSQILELVDNYGPFDALWLDGGTCKPKWRLDVDIPGIVDEARRRNPGLISVDRTTGGPYENVITPEQTIPPVPILAPWESCITLGKGWAYRPNDEYKSAREIVHLLVDVVAKGGNLALNVGPSPDGTFAPEAVERLDALGAWLARHGEAIYGTRPARPWRSGDWAFTGAKDGGSLYAIRLYSEGGRLGPGEMIPVDDDLKVARVVHLGTGREIPFTKLVGGVRLELPADFEPDAYADAFEILSCDDLCAESTWLESCARETVRAAERRTDGGLAVYAPDVGGAYRATWLRDYAYMLEADAVPHDKVNGASRLFVDAVSTNGWGVDCVKYDGTPVYKPGYGTMGRLAVSDGAPFTVAVAYLSWRNTGDRSWLTSDVLATLERVMAAAPVQDGSPLVFIDPNDEWERAAYGFTDSVRKKGHCLFESLLLFEAETRLAEMQGAAGCGEAAARHAAKARRIAAAVNETFWDDAAGLYRAATVSCREHDVWGSAFAVWLGVAEGRRADAVSRTFARHYAGLVRNGQLRHNLPGVYWEKACRRDTYQNGGFWGTPVGWFAWTLERTAPARVDELYRDLVADYRALGACEWSFGDRRACDKGYPASVCLPLVGVRRILAERQAHGRQ